MYYCDRGRPWASAGGFAGCLSIILASCAGPSSGNGGLGAPGASAWRESTSGVPDHVMTSDFYNGASENVTPQQAAPYLTWAEPPPVDQGPLDEVGIKTLFYLDPTYQMKTGPLYNRIKSTFAHTCSGRRIHRTDYQNPFYLMSRNNVLAQLAKTFIAGLFSVNPYDGIYEDSAGGLVTDWLSGRPCRFKLDPWIALDASLENTIAQPIVPSSLDGYRRNASGIWKNNPHSVGLAFGQYSLGGTTEECYSNQSNQFVNRISDTLWEAVENTEIELLAHKKLLFCMPNIPVAGDSQAGLTYRMYDDASFLLTYDPSYAILWEVFTTPSNFHVFPESQLVPLDPSQSQPADISQLNVNGAYVRAYGSCYYAGTLVGPCASVVNPSSSNSVPNPMYGSYYHTLVLSGAGVLDGGTATFNGSAAPETLPPQSAYVVFQ